MLSPHYTLSSIIARVSIIALSPPDSIIAIGRTERNNAIAIMLSINLALRANSYDKLIIIIIMIIIIIRIMIMIVIMII